MARTDRSRIEVFPAEGGFKMQRYDKYGRKAASTDKVFTLRNNTRREARKICREKNLGNIPIISIAKAGPYVGDQDTSEAHDDQPEVGSASVAPDYLPAAS